MGLGRSNIFAVWDATSSYAGAWGAPPLQALPFFCVSYAYFTTAYAKLQ